MRSPRDLYVLADKSGLSQETLLDVVELGAIANLMFKLKGPSMIKNNYPPAFPLKHQQKDMRLALALGDENAVSMPIAAAANEDKSSDVRKAAETRVGEILRVSGTEAVTKNLKDIRGPALVLERLHPSGAIQESFESTKGVSTGVASKTNLKTAKSSSNGYTDRSVKQGNKAISSELEPDEGA